MILCELRCERFISVLYDSMERNGWNGFDEWMCFKCGKTFKLDKKVAYDSNTLQLLFSSCPHPACSLCSNCYAWYSAPVATTDFQQFNILRLDYQLISFTPNVLDSIVGESDVEYNKCFIFNLLVCFIRAKVFKHILDIGGALMNLKIGVVCTLQQLFDNIGRWNRSDFIDLARQLDAADNASEMARILNTLFELFK